jgi:8-oxo-dGTP pyrophosphatase MutT (NUDIX family)
MSLRDAATVVLVRDAAPGFEVFMLLRTVRSDFNAGAYVFPGGAVDRGDAGAAQRLCSGLDDAQASARLGLTGGGLAFYLAAIRECFEEAGVLLAADAAGRPLSLHAPAEQRRFAEYRQALNAGQTTLADICARERLSLPLDAVHYYAHWITPAGMPRRYDTRFFLCRAPAGQEPLHDGQETVDHCWVRPVDALARHAAGGFNLVPATRKQLEFLARFADSDSLLAHVAALREIPAIQPQLILGADGRPERVYLPLPEGVEEIDLRGVAL